MRERNSQSAFVRANGGYAEWYRAFKQGKGWGREALRVSYTFLSIPITLSLL